MSHDALARPAMTDTPLHGDRAGLVSAGILIGAGMGGFLDGIVLHQILQWHNMLSSVHPPTDLVAMKFNMFWDGLFHAGTWCLTAAGIMRLWHACFQGRAPRAGRLITGSSLIGWGAFNLVEGIINHLILKIHHVHAGTDEGLWDGGFLALGCALILIGAALAHVRSDRHPHPPSSSF